MSFKKAYAQAIVDGRKTQTLRKATSLSEGDEVACFCKWGEPPFARVRIEAISWVSLWELTDADAQADGFPDRDELVKVLERLYPGTDRFAKLAFCVLEPAGAT
jgi:hypothetical protein